MEAVFLYAGQGSQRVGMGEDFYEAYPAYREVFDEVSGEAGFDLRELMRKGSEEALSQTEYTQPCMAAFAAGVTGLLIENGVRPVAACGLSLGEYGALYAAGAFSAKEYVRLTAYRGRAMAEAARGLTCCMSAVLGVESDVVSAACREYAGEGYVTVANYNCPGQTVLCGDESAVGAVEESLREKGAKRFARLRVSGPFHTKYMESAGKKLEAYLAELPFNPLQIPVCANVTGGYYGKDDDPKGLLTRQIQSGVRLEENLRRLLSDGYAEFVEIGPGTTMAGFLKRTAKALDASVNVCSIDTAEDFRKLTEGAEA